MITRRRIVVSVLVAFALAGFYLAYLQRGPNEQPVLRDEAVLLVGPAPGNRVLRQTEIFVDLDASYTGVLVINGVEIPEDQLDRTVGLNRVAFTPGDEKEIEELPAGQTCVRVLLWPVNEGRDRARAYPWCFEAH